MSDFPETSIRNKKEKNPIALHVEDIWADKPVCKSQCSGPDSERLNPAERQGICLILKK
jgi:hypothetical protein